MQEARVQSLGQKNPLEEEMATLSSILSWEIAWTEEPGRLQSLGSQRVRHNWVTEQQQQQNKLLLLPPIAPSIRVFSNESTLRMRWPKYWSFSFSIIPSKEYPGLISFGMDWLDLLAVQGTLKSLLQHHSSKASILWRSILCGYVFSHSILSDSLQP